MKRWIVLLAVLALVATACGGDDEGGGDDDATTTTTTAVDDGDDGDDMEVELRWRTRPDNQEEADVYQSISDQLSGELEGITLSYERAARRPPATSRTC
jgi:ABC-type glycerol-3-phosphate transport system substrate-binding protein